MKKEEFDNRHFCKRTGDLLEMHHSMEEQSLKARLQKEYDDLIETYVALYDYFKENGRVYSEDLLKDVTAIAESSYKYSQFAMVNALENLKNYDLVYVTAKGWTVRDIEYEAMVAKINDTARTPGKELNLGLGDIDGFIEEYDSDEASDMESQTSVKFRITISGGDGKIKVAFPEDSPFRFERPEVSVECRQSYMFDTAEEAIDSLSHIVCMFIDAGQCATEDLQYEASGALEENGEYIAQEPYREFKTSVIDSDLDGFCATLDINEGSIVKETLDNGDVRYRVLE